MPTSANELSRLDAFSFEHLANAVALRVLGAGHTGFGPGRDGGRDGYFEGEASYPSNENRWSGVWYIQSKFFGASGAKDPQKWIIEKIREEIRCFQTLSMERKWPDNWIIVTNVNLTAIPDVGSFDVIQKIIADAHPPLKDRFSIWGGR